MLLFGAIQWKVFAIMKLYLTRTFVTDELGSHGEGQTQSGNVLQELNGDCSWGSCNLSKIVVNELCLISVKL